MIDSGRFQHEKETVFRGVDFSGDDVGSARLEVMRVAEVVKQIGSFGLTVQHGETSKAIANVFGEQHEIVGGEVKHHRSRRRPLARLWSSPGRSHGDQVIDTEPGIRMLGYARRGFGPGKTA